MTPRAQRIFEAIANVFYDGDIELAFASARQSYAEFMATARQHTAQEPPEAHLQPRFHQ
ncbi:MAG: hypothetical protein ACOX2L_00755 [Anaerolineae bacterium]|nr:hypothetical protein [Chloroflexota bacterium]